MFGVVGQGDVEGLRMRVGAVVVELLVQGGVSPRGHVQGLEARGVEQEVVQVARVGDAVVEVDVADVGHEGRREAAVGQEHGVGVLVQGGAPDAVVAADLEGGELGEAGEEGGVAARLGTPDLGHLALALVFLDLGQQLGVALEEQGVDVLERGAVRVVVKHVCHALEAPAEHIVFGLVVGDGHLEENRLGLGE